MDGRLQSWLPAGRRQPYVVLSWYMPCLLYTTGGCYTITTSLVSHIYWNKTVKYIKCSAKKYTGNILYNSVHIIHNLYSVSSLHCMLSCAVYCNCSCLCLFVCGSALLQPAHSVCVTSEHFFISFYVYMISTIIATVANSLKLIRDPANLHVTVGSGRPSTTHVTRASVSTVTFCWRGASWKVIASKIQHNQ